MAALAFLAGCGGGDGGGGADDAAPGGSRITQQPEAAADPSTTSFPEAQGSTLKELADLASPALEYAPATATYSPGLNRVAFGLLNQANEIVYAPTALYVARTPNGAVRGPILAPADSLITEPAYRSKAAALESDPFASVYSADVTLPRSGSWSALVLSDTDAGLLGATAMIEVRADDPIPAVGDPAPRTHTETISDVGEISEIETRDPPDTMHDVDFADVVGEKPVALLFATPALCESRVCGPVTDIAEQLKTEYGDRLQFIHEEVYLDNDPSKGVRPALEDFKLRSEPWLFTFDSEGRVAARLEGSFGLGDFEQAIQAALE